MTRRRGIPHCRDWRVRYVDAQGMITDECIVSAPTKAFAIWNARERMGWTIHRVVAWPLRSPKPPKIGVYL